MPPSTRHPMGGGGTARVRRARGGVQRASSGVAERHREGGRDGDGEAERGARVGVPVPPRVESISASEKSRRVDSAATRQIHSCDERVSR